MTGSYFVWYWLNDHNYCLSRKRGELREVAKVRAAHSGISMRVATTEPGLQFYDGAKVLVPGIDGGPTVLMQGFVWKRNVGRMHQTMPVFPALRLTRVKNTGK